MIDEIQQTFYFGSNVKIYLTLGGLNEEMVKQTSEIVKKQLEKYDADKTGITDYALENLGKCYKYR